MNVIYEPSGKAREYSPLALNLYSGCTNGCKYCYVPAIRRTTLSAFAAASTPRNGILDKLRLDAQEMRATKDTRLVLMSFLSDPYPREGSELTRSAIRILGDAGIKMAVLTKNGSIAVRDFDLLAKHSGEFATTLVFDNEKDRSEWEPGADPIEARIEALHIAHTAGIHTWVSIEPVVYQEQSLALIERAHPFVDLFKVGRLNHVSNATDWHKFGHDAVGLLTRLGKQYYIKDDLKAAM